MEDKQNYFKILNEIDVSDKIEAKGKFNYLSWCFAWGELKKMHPHATSKVYETETGCIYHTDGKTAWVKTGVTVEGIEHIEYLPIFDYNNRSMKLDNITSADVNKSIQRSITKAIARHGVGLYIYAGEDLPETATITKTEKNNTTTAQLIKSESTILKNKVDNGNSQVKASYIDAQQVKCIKQMLDYLNNGSEKDLLKSYNIESLEQIEKDNYERTIKALNRRVEIKKAEQNKK